MFQSRVVFRLFSKQEIVTFPKLESFIHKNLRDEEVNDFWVHSRKKIKESKLEGRSEVLFGLDNNIEFLKHFMNILLKN